MLRDVSDLPCNGMGEAFVDRRLLESLMSEREGEITSGGKTRRRKQVPTHREVCIGQEAQQARTEEL
jgi:hypothetical protein